MIVTHNPYRRQGEQVRWSRQIVGNPMLRDDMEVPVPAQRLAYRMAWGFVSERGHCGMWHFTSGLLGLRASFNTIVAQYSASSVVVCTPQSTAENNNKKNTRPLNRTRAGHTIMIPSPNTVALG
jgi:hypothetical protein